MRTFIIAIVALVVGAAIGYFYEKNHSNELAAQIDGFKNQVSEQMTKTEDATKQIEELKADIEAKTKEIADYVAKITDMESNQNAAPAATDSTQPADSTQPTNQ